MKALEIEDMTRMERMEIQKIRRGLEVPGAEAPEAPEVDIRNDRREAA
jgi:hypothetical protein